MDLNKIKSVHFVGIKGVAMAALAIYFKQSGKKVSGSDTEEKFPTEEMLQKSDIGPSLIFSSENIVRQKTLDLVIYTGAHGGKDNIEVKTAQELKIPVLAHGQALGMVMSGKRQVSVAGSHGKTTTSAMIATILSANKIDPSYAIGCGEIFGLGPAGHFGKSKLFIAEADEYVTDPGHDATPRFLWQKPDIFVVTNIDYDHPDAYSSLEEVQKAFRRLQDQQGAQRLTVVNADDPKSKVLINSGKNIYTYGFSPNSDIRISDLSFGNGQTYFSLEQNRMKIDEFCLKVPGRHNAMNAAASAVVCQNLGVSWQGIRKGLLQFRGTKRRFEKIAEGNSISFYDDYAHHPSEIMATLAAAKKWYPQNRIVCIFQPHTYSRTKALLYEFAHAFAQCDLLILTEIYASARESDSFGFDGGILAQEVAKNHPRSYFAKNSTEVFKLTKKILLPGDIVIFMGAGSIYLWAREIVNNLKNS